MLLDAGLMRRTQVYLDKESLELISSYYGARNLPKAEERGSVLTSDRSIGSPVHTWLLPCSRPVHAAAPCWPQAVRQS